ncbi:mismatch-specific DNA-glycosylase [Bosea caraganae]|uniref:Mismatch-specific DNA-glycosylase n=1 Tax=Bosea caraganae TaxID=2763117 RepID=A0A370L5R7_9HYPH|nr:mismatch-specific DNA-glycosylase [Bosea caraganae]RDJ22305.1 mismatch-specific DNA-glycosylase [Bosea caraganae]RDJ23761.1 mismatch-specific DNA-glycosylase [Bosea caraganae]
MTILPDVLRPGLGIVFCGTQAGRVSALRRAYYAGPGNKFWKTLHAVELIPRELAPGEFEELPNFGLGLTDVAKLTSGPDTALARSHFGVDEFLSKMRCFAPAFIAFNGKRAAQAALGVSGPLLSYGLQPVGLGGSAVYVLPSTSGAASGFWSIEPWRELAAAWRTKREQAHL